MQLKAYRITIKDVGEVIYIAKNAGNAKTKALFALPYPDATYAWIIACRRAKEFDYLSTHISSCVAWSSLAGEHWQLDKGHWWKK